ncbi:MAG: hypothetical protein ABJA82_08895 [Myxococcales bacterium]
MTRALDNSGRGAGGDATFAAVVSLAVTLALAGCGGAIVHTRGDAATLIPNVTGVLAMPPRLSFGRLGDQRRTARRTGDTLIEATGGHAILSDELPSPDPELIADGLRSLGEDPQQTLTFSVIAARNERAEGSSVGGVVRVHRYADYVVRLDVRRADSPDVLGSIETFATAYARAPEVDDKGQPVGLQQAIDQAVHQALTSFAPKLLASTPFATIVEVPVRSEGSSITGALAAIDKLRRLQVLYPEQTAEELASLASSNARLMIMKPGRLAALGLLPGDLVSGMGGQTLGGRAAFARTLARGDTPALSIDRGGARFLIGQTLVAKAR